VQYNADVYSCFCKTKTFSAPSTCGCDNEKSFELCQNGVNPAKCQGLDDKANKACFAKETTTTCRITQGASVEASFDACYKGRGQAAELVLMAELEAGDVVLTATPEGSLVKTTVVVNQHLAHEVTSEILTLSTSDGASISLTPDHALVINGGLAPAAEAKIGASLTGPHGTSTTVKRIHSSAAPVVNAVTASGTILASDGGRPVLAASHPAWIAHLVVESPSARAVINAALMAAGDVPSIAAGVGVVCAKAAMVVLVLGLTAKARGRS